MEGSLVQMKFHFRNNVGDVSDTSSDEEEKELIQIDDDEQVESGSDKYCEYPVGSPNTVIVRERDYLSLEHDTYLNDSVIDFYLNYVHQQVLPQDYQGEVHIFSSFFYKRLLLEMPNSEKDLDISVAERRHARVSAWTKNVDIFSKSVLIIPICEDSHWYFLMVVGLSGVLSSSPVLSDPFVLVLDSMGEQRKKTARIIRQYLASEFEAKQLEGECGFTDSDIPSIRPAKPEQPNGTDCGIYLLHYVEKIFGNISNFLTPNLPNLERWFSRQEVARKRSDIAALVRSLSREQKPERKIRFPDIPFTEKEAKALENIVEVDDDNEDKDPLVVFGMNNKVRLTSVIEINPITITRISVPDQKQNDQSKMLEEHYNNINWDIVQEKDSKLEHKGVLSISNNNAIKSVTNNNNEGGLKRPKSSSKNEEEIGSESSGGSAKKAKKETIAKGDIIKDKQKSLLVPKKGNFAKKSKPVKRETVSKSILKELKVDKEGIGNDSFGGTSIFLEKETNCEDKISKSQCKSPLSVEEEINIENKKEGLKSIDGNLLGTKTTPKRGLKRSKSSPMHGIEETSGGCVKKAKKETSVKNKVKKSKKKTLTAEKGMEDETLIKSKVKKSTKKILVNADGINNENLVASSESVEKPLSIDKEGTDSEILGGTSKIAIKEKVAKSKTKKSKKKALVPEEGSNNEKFGENFELGKIPVSKKETVKKGKVKKSKTKTLVAEEGINSVKLGEISESVDKPFSISEEGTDNESLGDTSKSEKKKSKKKNCVSQEKPLSINDEGSSKSEKKETEIVLGVNSKSGDKEIPTKGKAIKSKQKFSNPINLPPPDENTCKISNDLKDSVKTLCKICNEPYGLSNMRGHTQGKHSVQISKYKEIYGQFEIIEFVYHKCELCGKLCLLDSDHLGGHVKGSHKMKQAEYYEKYLIMTSLKNNKRSAKKSQISKLNDLTNEVNLDKSVDVKVEASGDESIDEGYQSLPEQSMEIKSSSTALLQPISVKIETTNEVVNYESKLDESIDEGDEGYQSMLEPSIESESSSRELHPISDKIETLSDVKLELPIEANSEELVDEGSEYYLGMFEEETSIDSAIVNKSPCMEADPISIKTDTFHEGADVKLDDNSEERDDLKLEANQEDSADEDDAYLSMFDEE